MSALTPHSISTPTQKDRFLAFAFAAADLLVEVREDGVINFAAGAFNARFGGAPEQFIGRHIRHLFAPGDQPGLDLALSVTGLRGRLSPVVLRLSDGAATPVVVSALAMPNAPGRMCFTLGRLPALPSPSDSAAPPASFARAVEAHLRTEPGGAVGLLEVGGWDQVRSTMSGDAQRALQTEITDALSRLGGPGSVAGEIAEGRYGVLSAKSPDLRLLASELERVLRAHPATFGAAVHGTGLSLDHADLTGAQAARALRFALARFASGGLAATEAAGFRDGLAEFIAGAELRARSVRATIAEGRFRLAFQPVVSLSGRAVHHYEALLRPIFSPGSIIQTTQDFVTFAEAVGLSEELDWAVMQQAMVAAVDAPAGTSVAVNISGLSVQSPTFRDKALGILHDRRSRLAGRMLMELTETADIEDTRSAAQTIAGFREAQVPVCIDDFGAGSAAFRYLREFQVDFVKLDGAYVRGAMNNAREHGFLMTMVELANFVGARVVAETIETTEQADAMQKAGIEFGQGWLFGRPGALPGMRSASRPAA